MVGHGVKRVWNKMKRGGWRLRLLDGVSRLPSRVELNLELRRYIEGSRVLYLEGLVLVGGW